MVYTSIRRDGRTCHLYGGHTRQRNGWEHPISSRWWLDQALAVITGSVRRRRVTPERGPMEL